MEDYSISVYLDTRRRLKSKKFPLKLRVFLSYPRKQKLYGTKFNFTEKDFQSIWLTQRPRNAVKAQRAEIQSFLNKAEKTAAALNPFTFEAFEEALYAKSNIQEDVLSQYDKAIKQYINNNQIGTAENYSLSKKSVMNFMKNTTGKENKILLFREITPKWLLNYENYMLKERKSNTTIGIYLRPLRSLFNAAISTGIVDEKIYPFGKRKYEIPHPKSAKKALNRDQLKRLYEAKPTTEEQSKAKDFFFFIFNTSGMNVKDIAQLKYENLQNDKLIYIREKTKRTSKSNLKSVEVFLNSYSQDFIKKYGNPDIKPDNFIFDIYETGMSELEKYNRSNNFTRFLNQHLKKLAAANDLPANISTYWARHSFATNAIRNGASLELISQALNHHDLSTTKSYFAGFEDDALRDLTKNLMDFD